MSNNNRRERQKKEIRTYSGNIYNTKFRLQQYLASLVPFIPYDLVYSEIFDILGDIKNKTILEIGAGRCGFSKELLKHGCTVHSTDISIYELNFCKNSNDKHNKPIPIAMTAEEMCFKDNCFDIVVGISTLHHTHVPYSMSEIQRVLKKGGKACFVEPLGNNPISNLWRKVTPDYRSPDEKPLVYEEIPKLGNGFSDINHIEFRFLTLLISFIKIFTKNEKMLRPVIVYLHNKEKKILYYFPIFKKFCGSTILFLEK
jgi:ubiquinone/menaquinone biosynthesis C-methylase UbiE